MLQNCHNLPVKCDISFSPSFFVNVRSNLLDSNLSVFTTHPLGRVGHIKQIDSHFWILDFQFVTGFVILTLPLPELVKPFF